MEQISNEWLENLRQEVFNTALKDRSEMVSENLERVKTFIADGLKMIQIFERATHLKHPPINLDTDTVYIDSGPGPYSYDPDLLEPGKTDLDDLPYHKWPWSRNMDRGRVRAAYTLVGMITAGRIKKETDVEKQLKDLTPDDYKNFGPYLMYTSTTWQNSHIRHVFSQLKKSGQFKIPDSKLIMYEEFINREGERKPIVHTEDQIEGLKFPLKPDGNPPRRVAVVSHPAHLMRIMHILGKYPDSIPNGTRLQPFPIPTPIAAVTEYAKNELIGTMVSALIKNRASLRPYDKYQL